MSDNTGPIIRRRQVATRDGESDPTTLTGMEFPELGGDSVVQAHAEARRIVDQARESAAQLMRESELIAERERQRAHTEGLAAGRAEGLAIADRDGAGVIKVAEEIAANVFAEREALLERSEGELVELAIHLAERIVGTSLELQPELVVDALRGALRKAFQRDVIYVLAHPDDLDILRSAGPLVIEELGGIDRMEFVAERRLERGGVVVRTPAGEIDATIDGKRTKISAALRDVIAQRISRQRTGAADEQHEDSAAQGGTDVPAQDGAATMDASGTDAPMPTDHDGRLADAVDDTESGDDDDDARQAA